MRKDILPHSTFNSWTVLQRVPDKSGVHYYLCRCDCGREKEVDKYGLTSGRSKNCGKCDDLQPQSQFNRWAVLKKVPSKGKGKPSHYLCRCDCGAEREVERYGLTSGRSKSCGCLQKEVAKDAAIQRYTTHGMTHSKTYNTWAGMLTRCYNKNQDSYKDYGGRGITVCDRWRNSFTEFLADMGERPKGCSIERVDNDKGYSPENCIWADYSTQAKNTRRTRHITFGGKTMSVLDWSNEIGIHYERLRDRLNRGWLPAR